MSEDANKKKENKLEFNTYCIWVADTNDIAEIIGIMFRDYIEDFIN